MNEHETISLKLLNVKTDVCLYISVQQTSR